MESDEVKKRIEADMAEAQGFGIQGTPGFVVAGVVIRGAYPKTHFDMIISKKLGTAPPAAATKQ